MICCKCKKPIERSYGRGTDLGNYCRECAMQNEIEATKANNLIVADLNKKLNRLAELEDKIEQGTLFELPCVRKINNALGSYEAVYINERDLVQESLVLTPEQGWLIIRKYACPKHQAEAEKKLKELKGEV